MTEKAEWTRGNSALLTLKGNFEQPTSRVCKRGCGQPSYQQQGKHGTRVRQESPGRCNTLTGWKDATLTICTSTECQKVRAQAECRLAIVRALEIRCHGGHPWD